jgi:hypothetical protein
LTRLKNAAEVFNYLQSNEIFDMAGLEHKVDSMNAQAQAMGKGLNDIERRIKTLDGPLMHSGNFKNYRKTKRRYDELYAEYQTARKEKGFFAERKAQKALDAANEYYQSHSVELAMFDNAEEYLRGVLQGRFDPKKLPPTAMWQNELSKKINEKSVLYREYYALKDETKKVEQIKRSVMDILHSDAPKQTPTRMRGLEM